MTTTEHRVRHQTHSRYDNQRLIEAVLGRRSWQDIGDAVIDTSYDDAGDAERAAILLGKWGLIATANHTRLLVIVGEHS